MALKTIEIEITPDGVVLVELNGYQGVGCDAIAEAITGQNAVISEVQKPEYHLRQPATQYK
jgi:hypothetical protein